MRLGHLQINFESRYCSCGCCRVLGQALQQLTTIEWIHSPKLIDIRGVQDEQDILSMQGVLDGNVAKCGTVLLFKEDHVVIHKIRVLSETIVSVQESLIEEARDEWQ